MKKGFSNYFTKALLIILILSFALWGMGDFFNVTSGNYAIKVNKTEISKHEWRQLLANKIQEEEQRQRRSLSEDYVSLFNIKRQLTSDLETNLLLLEEAKRLGILIHDDTVKNEILKIPAFQRDNKFDQDVFSKIMQNIGLTEQDFIDKIKEDLSRRYLLSALTSHKLISNNTVQQFIDIFFEKRKILLVEIPKQSVLKDINVPNEQELKKIYEKNKAHFKTNEKRKISYVLIGFDNVSLPEVDEEKLKKIYEEKLFLFQEPEKRTVKQIVFTNNKDAKEAKLAFISGKNLQQISSKYNGNLQNEDLGYLTKEELSGNLSDVIFALPENKISDPVETPLGWNLFIVTKIIPSITKPFKDVKAFLQKQYILEQQYIELNALIKKIGAELKDITTLEELAKEYNLKIYKTILEKDHLDEVLLQKPISNFSDSNKKEFYSKAIGLKSISDYSSIFPVTDTEFCIIQLDSIIEPSFLDLDKSKDKVIAIWKQDQMSKHIAEIVNKLKSKIINTKEKNIKHEYKNDIAIKEMTITRDNYNERIPNKLVKEIFEINPRSFTKVVKDLDGNYLIAYIESKSKPTQADSVQYWPQAQFELTNIEQNALLSEYINSLRGKYKVSIDQSIFKNESE